MDGCVAQLWWVEGWKGVCVCVCGGGGGGGGGGGIKWQVAFTDIAFPPIKTILPLAVEAKAIACIRSLDREWESHALTYNGLCL